MPVCLRPIVVLAAVLAFGAGRADAEANQVAPSALVPALNLYVDSIVAGHATADACADVGSAARDEKAWAEAGAILVATLWANGFAADFIHQAETKLSTPPTVKPSCPIDGAVGFDVVPQEKEGWVGEINRTISSLDLTPVEHPVTVAGWKAIEDMIAAELPLQARLIECVAVSLPAILPVTVHDWDAMLAKIGGKLVAAGLPHDEITTALSVAEANSIWHRAAPDAVAALRTSCDADKTWSDRFYNFEFLTLGGKIDKLLPGQSDAN